MVAEGPELVAHSDNEAREPDTVVLRVCTNYEHEHVSTKGHVIVSRSVRSDPSDRPSPTLQRAMPNPPATFASMQRYAGERRRLPLLIKPEMLTLLVRH